jgi:anti-sigma regulatory factor (Ser/Thr protein kinase)
MLHDAIFYSADDEYVTALRAFVDAGLDDGAAVLIAVPGPKLALLQPELGSQDGVDLVDMQRAGLNPGRIIPFIRSFVDAHSDRPVRFVGEPIWAGRSEREVVEGVRHEGLINAAFADTDAYILCPYDTRDLPPTVLADARHTHPTILADGERHACGDYVDPLVTYAADDHPLPAPTTVPLVVSVDDGLVRFRSVVRDQAETAGIASDRATAFLVAANEAAANTVIHAGGDGFARIWRDDGELVCELSDSGVIHDPLVGRREPPPDAEGGRGIYLMHQLGDLVELRSGPQGTVVRIHMRLDP